MISNVEILQLLHKTYDSKWKLSSTPGKYEGNLRMHLASLPDYPSVGTWLASITTLSHNSRLFLLSMIRSAMRRYGYAEQATQLPNLPQPPAKKHRKQAMQEIQWAQLKPRLVFCLQFLEAFGCRASEAFDCKVEDGTLLINCSKNDSVIDWPMDALPTKQRLAMESWLEIRPSYKLRTFYHDVDMAKKEGLIPDDFTAHALRYNFITKTSERLQLVDVSKAVGHKRLETTNRYVQQDRRKLAGRVFLDD